MPKNTTITLIISLAAALGSSIAKKYYTKKGESGSFGNFLFTAACSLISACVLLIWSEFGEVSSFTVLLGLAFGAITTIQGIAHIAALQTGPLSYTAVIISFSTLIPALSGALFFGEGLSLSQIIGIVLMLISFLLATGKKTNETRANFKWLILCLIAFAATGGIGVMQKIHQSSPHRAELDEFLVIAFFASSLLSLLILAFIKGRGEQKQTRNGQWILFFLGITVLSGVCVAVNNKLNLYLSGVMDSAVFFPIVNGGGLVLTTLTAVILFRERLEKKQWVGVIIGILSVIFLCEPFPLS
ncbi:MAG: EamA family transporter [Clostridia bacterium]|nr:EamA family transporter [Clostridia bacterium]